MAYLRSLGLNVPARRALDFGSGLGRTTQALADHFDEVVGVDVAPSMIEQARQHNRHGTRCAFLLHQSDDLGLFGEGDFSFVYSNIVLQHIRPRYTRRYVREFLRVLSADGVALFQLPSHPAAGLPRAGRLRRLPGPLWATVAAPPSVRPLTSREWTSTAFRERRSAPSSSMRAVE